MRTIADHQTLNALVGRLRQLRPDTTPRWGTLTAAEMLCHLGDAHESVLGLRIPPGPLPSGKPRPLYKWMALYLPFPWPKGVPTRPGVNPKIDGTRPGHYEQDRARAISSLTSIAKASDSALSPAHVMFGPMSKRDWQRWAYRHVGHHLRQFGV